MLLAYDHSRVVSVRTVLREAIDHLGLLATDRVLLSEAPGVASAASRTAVDLADPWLARVDGIIACTALMLADEPSPDGTTTVTIDDVDDLVLLSGRLAAELQVDAHAAGPGVTDVDHDALAAIAAIAEAVPSDSRAGRYPVALESMPPLAAALVLQHLSLDDRTLATVTDRLLRRWRDGADPTAARWTPWPDQRLAGITTAAVLGTLLLRRPAALTDVAQRMADRPEAFIAIATTTEELAEILGRATDPARVEPAVAGSILVPLIRWWGSDDERLLAPPLPHGVDLGMALATVTPPWVREFSSRAAEWSWSADEGHAALARLADDETRFDRFMDGYVVHHQRLLTEHVVDARGALDLAVFDDLYGSFSMMVLVAGDERLQRARMDRALAELVGEVGMFFAGRRVPAVQNPMLGLGIAAALDRVVPLSTDLLAGLGLAPPSADQVERHIEADHALLSARLTVAAVGTVVAGFVAGGRLDADIAAGFTPLRDPRTVARAGGCPASAAYDDTRRLVDEASPHLSDDDRHRLVTTLFARANPESVAVVCHSR